MMIKRNGGLTFWRVGRLGGSWYVARNRPRGEWAIALRESGVEILVTALTVAALFGWAS